LSKTASASNASYKKLKFENLSQQQMYDKIAQTFGISGDLSGGVEDKFVSLRTPKPESSNLARHW